MTLTSPASTQVGAAGRIASLRPAHRPQPDCRHRNVAFSQVGATEHRAVCPACHTMWWYGVARSGQWYGRVTPGVVR